MWQGKRGWARGRVRVEEEEQIGRVAERRGLILLKFERRSRLLLVTVKFEFLNWHVALPCVLGSVETQDRAGC